MRLLSEANEIIKSMNFVLDNTDIDKDSRKEKIEAVLKLKDLIQD